MLVCCVCIVLRSSSRRVALSNDSHTLSFVVEAGLCVGPSKQHSAGVCCVCVSMAAVSRQSARRHSVHVLSLRSAAQNQEARQHCEEAPRDKPANTMACKGGESTRLDWGHTLFGRHTNSDTLVAAQAQRRRATSALPPASKLGLGHKATTLALANVHINDPVGSSQSGRCGRGISSGQRGFISDQPSLVIVGGGTTLGAHAALRPPAPALGFLWPSVA